MVVSDLNVSVGARAILRDRVRQNAIARAVFDANREMRSNACNLGNHARDFPGCADDGSTCLCECHDPKDG